MNPTRRSLLAASGALLPFGLAARSSHGSVSRSAAPALGFRSFEESVRAAFREETGPTPCRRIEIGHSDQVRVGLQGCHNVRPFAGFPARSLRILRTDSRPGPIYQGVRLYVSTVDVVRTSDRDLSVVESRPLDFALIPPAPCFQ